MLKEDKIQEILQLVREGLYIIPNHALYNAPNESEKLVYVLGNRAGRNQAQRVLADILYNLDALK